MTESALCTTPIVSPNVAHGRSALLVNRRYNRRMHLWALLFAGAILPAQVTTSAPIIQTIAGTDWTFQGDGKRAVDAPLGPVRSLPLLHRVD